jgi:hypothetical protein
MIAFPLICSVGLKAATALSRVAMLPMFVRSRPLGNLAIGKKTIGAMRQTGFAARAGAQANHALTFKPDHHLGLIIKAS